MADQSPVPGKSFPPGVPAQASGQQAPAYDYRWRPAMNPPGSLKGTAGGFQGKTLPWHVTALLIALAGAILMGGLGFAFYMADQQARLKSEETASIQAVIDRYLVSPAKHGPPETQLVLGRVVLVDQDQHRVDDLHFTLPDEVRAHKPEEATSVGQLRYTRKQVGTYQNGRRAIQVGCELTVIDLASGGVIGKRSFDWGPPPSRVSSGSGEEDVVGDAPWKEIGRFLAALR